MKTLIRLSAAAIAIVLFSTQLMNAQRGYGQRGNFRTMPGTGYGNYMKHFADSACKADTALFRGPGYRHMQAPGMGRMPGRNGHYAWGPAYGGMRGAGPGFHGNFSRGPVPGYGFRGDAAGTGRIDLLPGLTDKQKKDIDALRQKQFTEIEKLRTETRTKMQSMRDEHRKKMLELLTEEQKNALGGFKPAAGAAAPKTN